MSIVRCKCQSLMRAQVLLRLQVISRIAVLGLMTGPLHGVQNRQPLQLESFLVPADHLGPRFASRCVCRSAYGRKSCVAAMLLTLELFPGQGLGDFALGEAPACVTSAWRNYWAPRGRLFSFYSLAAASLLVNMIMLSCSEHLLAYTRVNWL